MTTGTRRREHEQVRPPSGGWRIVAAKELGDHLLSSRFSILVVIIGLAALGSVYAAAGGLRDAAADIVGVPALFLRLFTVSADPIPFSFVVFVGFLAPLLGIAFGFDAVNGERSQGTLPRLVSQPIYRDDVVNGKFVAGLTVVGVTLAALTTIVAGLGILRLGIVPTAAEVARLVAWLAVTVAYVGFWLAFATLCSVLMRRASTSALVAIGLWVVLTLFAPLLFSIVADVVAPAPPGATAGEQLRNAQVELTVSRISPVTLFDEATTALLNPEVRTLGIVTFAQLDRAVLSELTLGQSLLLVWPQIVGLVAFTVICFAVAYVAFIRQEIRA